MRLEDSDTREAREQIDREHAAEQRRMMREASCAFSARAEAEAHAPPRLTGLSMQRRAEVSLARAIVTTLGDVYGAGAQRLGVAR